MNHWGNRRAARSSIGQHAVLLALVLVLALGSLVAGAGVALVGPYFVALMAALVLGAFALFVPLAWLFWLLLVVTFLVVGGAQYFGGVSKAFWAPYLIGLVLWLRVPMELRSGPLGTVSGHAQFSADTGLFLAAVSLYVATAAASLAFNQPPFMPVVISMKEYVFLGSVCLLLALGHGGTTFASRVWLALLWFVPLQLPVVLYQRFVVAANRVGRSAWDSVVGLFGGDPEGGGASGALAFFLIFGALLALSMWKSGLLKARYAALIVVCALASIAMAEVKVAMVMLPLGLALLFRSELIRRPLRGVSFIAGGIALSIALLAVYQAQYGSRHTAAGSSVKAYAIQMFERATDTESFDLATAQMNRTTALVYWWRQHSLTRPAQFLLGHGVGSTKVGSLGVGEVAKHHRFRVNPSAASQLLWDMGLLGLAAVCLFLMAGAAMAAHAAQDRDLAPQQRAVAAAAVPALWLMVLGLFYNTDFVGTPQAQLLAMLLLGYVYRLRWLTRVRLRAEASA